MNEFRPWGEAQWLLRNFSTKIEWCFLGSISPEDRALATYDYLKLCGLKFSKTIFLIIKDKESRYTRKCGEKVASHCSKLSKVEEIQEFDLLYNNDSDIVNFIDSIANSNKNLILDISCMPKRFFFPFIKRIVRNHRTDNFVVTNASPQMYEVKKPLSESYGAWRPLPLFLDTHSKNTDIRILFSIGHLPMGSPGPIYDICDSTKITLFFPFPGHPHSFESIWRFVFDIEQTIENKGSLDIQYVNSHDCSEFYNRLVKETNEGTQPSVLAPYGPKSFSLAMALFANKHEQPVYYTQPRVYHPDYSVGILKHQGLPVVLSYVIKFNGKTLY